MNLENLQFIILPANLPPHTQTTALHNQAYAHYKNSWERIFNRPGREPHYNADHFLRQDYIFEVLDKNEVVCQILGTHFHLDHDIMQDLTYFENFKTEAQEILKAEKVKRLMSLEYSSVNRDYSPKFSGGINFGEIITFLGVQYAKALGVEVILGQPRRVTGTNNRLFNIGFRKVKECITKFNLSVDLTFGFMNEIHPELDPAHQKLITHLWAHRQDFMGLTTGQSGLLSSYYQQDSKQEKNIWNQQQIQQQFAEEL